MLNKEKHRLIIGRIVEDIYRDITIAPQLGFKGGTAAYLFYGLPRFSVDLDFDLLGNESEELNRVILSEIKKIIERYGQVRESRIKRFTIFSLLSYGRDDHNIKVEINTRKFFSDIKNRYEFKENLGIPMLIAKPDYMFATKLAALTDRKKMAMRDVFDIHYFAKNNWDIDKEALLAQTGKNVKEQLLNCVDAINKIKYNQILQGLGELLDEKQKDWVRLSLRQETVSLLKNYAAAINS
jgi:predicted nucleotidyltransferase component of viral defense system